MFLETPEGKGMVKKLFFRRGRQEIVTTLLMFIMKKLLCSTLLSLGQLACPTLKLSREDAQKKLRAAINGSCVGRENRRIHYVY